MEKLYEAKSVCVIKLIQENYLPTLARHFTFKRNISHAKRISQILNDLFH